MEPPPGGVKLARNPALGYALTMRIDEYFIVFPEGDVQAIAGRLRVNALVDINGYELDLPLASNKMIVFRVARVQVKENRGGSETLHYLEQLSAGELIPYTRGGL
jgi:hypothetical protein